MVDQEADYDVFDDVEEQQGEEDEEDSDADREEILKQARAEGPSKSNAEKLEGLAGELPGSTGWEKLKAYADQCIKNSGKDQVDNVDIDEYGPHTLDPDYKGWATGVFECWNSTPWEERAIIGHLEWPSGETVILREGDLPNRRPYLPDPCDLPQKYVKPRKNTKWASEELARNGGDPSKLKHWINDLRSEEKDTMPPGGYPHPNGTSLPPDDTSSTSDHQDSEMYEELRNTAMELYGMDSIPMIKAMDKVVNYTGLEPQREMSPPRKGEEVVRWTAEGDVDGVVAYESDEASEGLEGTGLERVHERMWHYAKAGK